MVRVSVVTTERNETKTIERFIKGILDQSYPADELVICDGNSNDGTISSIKKLVKKNHKIKLVVKSGNRSIGRNAAIKLACNNIIAMTDVGTVAHKDWLKFLIKPFEEDPKTMVVGGFFKIKSQSLFEEVSANQMLYDHNRIDPETWLPSSRSIAFKKEAWLEVGGYPEQAKYNEDTPFDLSLKKAGYKFAFAPKAIVYWRPRPNLKEFFKQYYNYAIGDGIGLIHWPNYLRKVLIYLFGVVLIILGFTNSWSWFVLGVGGLLYFLRRGRRVLWKTPTLKTFVLSVLITLTNDLADITGYIVGLF
jgi:cellulose synthase/poly-beta-1,6-N-acetylglucosamine synthase-like glycosyltransferase